MQLSSNRQRWKRTTKAWKVVRRVSGLNEWVRMARQGLTVEMDRDWPSGSDTVGSLCTTDLINPPHPPTSLSAPLFLFASLSDRVGQRQNMSLLLLSCLGALQPKSSLSVSVCGFEKQLLHSLITMHQKRAGLKQTPSLRCAVLSLSNTKAGQAIDFFW